MFRGPTRKECVVHCDTSNKPRINLALSAHPRAVHVAITRFVRGVRGPRENPVTRQQIRRWLAFTPPEIVDVALNELVLTGEVRTVALALRGRTNRASRAYGYELA